MRLKLVVIDLELTRRQKTAVGAGLSLALLLVGAVALGDVPVTFAAGDTLKAADLNENFEALDKRLADLPTITGWVPYTPVVTGGSTELTATGAARWRRVGDTLEVSIDSLFSTCSTGNATLSWSLPVGLIPDYAKLSGSNAQIGMALTVSPGQVGTANVLAQGPSGAVVALQQGNVVISCGQLGNNGNVRLRFAIPIAGWDVSN